VYLEALAARVQGRPLLRITLKSPFLLRSVAPPLSAAGGRTVTGLRLIGKRIVLELGDELSLVLHLMIAGRLRWVEPGGKLPGKLMLAAFDFPNGTLVLTEAGSQRRASLHVVGGAAALREFDRGGIDVRATDPAAFARRLRAESHTLKRALTDPRLFNGIGNAYSDEILHAARLSPLALTRKVTDAEIARLHAACVETLQHWTERLRQEAGGGFPRDVTAFREGMAVHGRFGKPCPVCGAPVQRIRYAQNETNYCARCQTGGRLLADRALSRLLKGDWPRSPDELE
jgi:formamidopyrimidine-DNA glycosylase